ncbi:MAG: diguanylate phosphodiesterase, partial [Acetivibrio ethanolgignens]
MDTFIARQAIFDKKGNVVAYELLYRSSEKSTRADLVDGDRATLQVLSDAITVFGLPYLTNSKMAFVNFTENLLLRDTALLASPEEIAVEILEDV